MGQRNVYRLLESALKKGDTLHLTSSETAAIKPKANDTGKLTIGDGTNDMDFQIYVGSANESFLFDVGNSKLTATAPIESNTAINAATIKTTGAITAASMAVTGAITPSGSGSVDYKVATSAANALTINSTHYGSHLTLTGSGSGTITLPTPAAGTSGKWVVIKRVSNVNTTINCVTANKIVALNNATANSVAFSTANQKIGATALCVADAAKWYVVGLAGTATIA